MIFTICALPLYLLGNGTAIFKYTPLQRSTEHVDVSSGLWLMIGDVNGIEGNVKKSNPQTGHFDGSITDQMKPFESNPYFDNPSPWLSVCAAMNLLISFMLFISLCVQVVIYSGKCVAIYDRRNRIFIVVFSALIFFFSMLMVFFMMMITSSDLWLWDQLSNGPQTAVNKSSFNSGWFLIMISNNGNRTDIFEGCSFKLDYAFITPIVGFGFVVVLFCLSFGFSVAAKIECATIREEESKLNKEQKKLEKEKEKLLRKQSKKEAKENKKKSLASGTVVDSQYNTYNNNQENNNTPADNNNDGPADNNNGPADRNNEAEN